jgi:predicted kinase
LVGPPAIGKSTWVKQNAPGAFIVSRDDIVNKVADKYNLTYDDMFDPANKDKNKEINHEFSKRIPEAMNSGKDIVVDMTNMSVGARKRILGSFNKVIDNYKKIAVVFNFEGSDVKRAIKNIAAKRAEEIKASGGSKTIPPFVFDKMFASYEQPTREEGFDDIINVDDSKRLLQSLE